MPSEHEIRDRLLAAARAAALHAYCPYSHFRVGAAVLLDGQVLSGCNIENASFGLTICAERTAIFTAVAAGLKRISAIAVTCPDAPANSPTSSKMPCGACRQVIAEFATADAKVYVDGVGEFTVQDLLPDAFRL